MIELAALLAVLAVVGSLLLVLGKGSRHSGWQAGSIANLHEFAAITASYQADYADQFWSYSWPSNTQNPTIYPDLQSPRDPLATASAQAVDLIRRRGRADMPPITLWSPTFWAHHLPLADYLGCSPLMRFAVSPGDRNRLLWTNDPSAFFAGAIPNQPPVSDPQDWRWLYTSSYWVPQAFFSPDAVSASRGTIVLAADWNHYEPLGPSFDFGGRRLAEVAYPSQKVHVFDTHQWQGVRRPVFAMYAFARAPLLMVDGSAHVRVTSDANHGFRPDLPRSPFPTVMAYGGFPWDQAVVQGAMLMGSYCWTRAGIMGRDFDGQEVSTANW